MSTAPAGEARAGPPTPLLGGRRGSRTLRRSRALGALVLLLAASSFTVGALYGSLPAVDDVLVREHAIDARSGTGPVRVKASMKIARSIVAVEDERFLEHGAIDALSVARAIRVSLSGSGDPAGSTIAQQLAKVLYAEPESLIGRLRSIGLAAKLEHRYSKNQILELYLNSIYLGHGFYGLNTASHGYFRTSPDQLSWAQASLLAGLAQAPSAYDPLRHLALARARQRQVLAQLVDNHVLTPDAARRVARDQLHLSVPRGRRASRAEPPR